MDEVQVVAERALFEQQVDRTVVNVAGVATASGISALEVLERSPGIIINRPNNSISMSGKEGVVLMINGRITYMPMEAVFQMLAGMNSDNIDKIELITTPPSKYDAEGNAGFINIVLKKNPNEGLSGSYNLMAGYGEGFRTSAGLSTAYVKGKWSLTADYTFTHNDVDQIFAFYRENKVGEDDIITDSYNDRQPVRNNHNLRLGADFRVTPQGTLSAQVMAYNNQWTMDSYNTGLLYKNGVLDTQIFTLMEEVNHWQHLGGTLRYDHRFDSKLNISAESSYLWYSADNPTMYTNDYYTGGGEYLFTHLTRAWKMTPINVTVSQVDLSAPWGANTKWEAGAKATFSQFTNDVGVDYDTGQGWDNAEELTNVYDLNEYVLAAYASLEHSFTTKTKGKIGLRYEYTDSELGSEEDPGIVDRTFGSLFPTAYLSHSFSDKYTASISYARRITRPTFNDLAPFLIFVDPYTFYIGNPALQPAISANLDLNVRLNRLQVGLSYNEADSAIARYQAEVIEGTNYQAWSSQNLTLTRVYAVSLAMPVDVGKSWRMYYSLAGQWNEAFKYIEGTLTQFEAGNVNLFSSQTFKLPKDFLFEISGYINTGGLWGINVSQPVGAVNLALQKKFGKDGGTLRLGYDDLFNTQIYRNETNLPQLDQYFTARYQFSRPGVKVTYTRSFGNQQAKVTRRASAADEERKRVTE
jgi:hypothetical protein